MRPDQVRQRVLDDHARLRGNLASLEQLATQVVNGERQLTGALRVEGEGLLEFLLEHMRWEDEHLAPALREAGGEELVKRLEGDHREQRELLEHALERLQDQSRPSVLVGRNLMDLIALLREDIREEEERLLDPEGPVDESLR